MTSSKNDWKETKSKIKAQFSKLSDSDIDSLKGHLDKLQMKVQKVYNYDETKAKEECKAFFTNKLNKR